MTETSQPWDGLVVGDATFAPYSSDEWSEMFAGLFGSYDDCGVVPGILEELEVSGAVSPVTVHTGRALVRGRQYDNDSDLTLVVNVIAVNPRYDVVVLRCDWTLANAQTIRAAIVQGVEGGGVPALTQTYGTRWEIPLATLYVTVGVAAPYTVTDIHQEIFGPAHYDFVRAIEMNGDNASPAGWSDTYNAWRFDPTTDELVWFTTWVPFTHRGRVQMWLFWGVQDAPVPPADTVQWAVNRSLGMQEGDDPFTIIGATTGGPYDVVNNHLYVTEFHDAVITPPFNGFIRWYIMRDADHANDDYPNDAWVFGALVKYS